MLDRIATVIKDRANQVVLRHPNRMRGFLYRPAVNEDAVHGDIGGIGTLDSIEDSETEHVAKLCEITYLQLDSQDELGFSRGLGNESPAIGEAHVLIVCDDSCVQPTSHDLIVTTVGNVAGFAFEITEVKSDVHLGSGTRRYTIQYRDELTWIAGD